MLEFEPEAGRADTLTCTSYANDPTPQNGYTKRCYALSHCVATTSARRVRQTTSRIAEDELMVIRRQIALAIGLE
jgi:mRNA interferase MazF